MKKSFFAPVAMLAISITLFGACASEEENVGGGSDEQVTVRFTVSEQSFGTTETVAARSAGSSSEEKVVEEKLIPVGGNLYAKTKLVEHTPAATRETTALTEGYKVRIYAYDNETDKTFENYADYVLDGGQLKSLDKSTGDPDPTAGLSVSPGEHYFVAISFNSATLPAFDETIDDILPGTDLLYCAKTQNVWVSDADISLTLKHRFSQVKVSFSTAGIGSPNITAISGVNVRNACAVNFVPADNTVEPVNAPGLAVPFNGGAAFSGSSASVTSDAVVAFLDMSPLVGYDVGYLQASVTIEGFASPVKLDTGFEQKFEENHSYELQVDFSYLYFAGSNIYWDGDNLTFDEWGEYDNSLYQGVFFKWGSLVGISPAQTNGSSDFDAATTPIYVQTAADSRQWKATTPASTTYKPEWSDWAAIPYVNESLGPNNSIYHSRNDLATYTSDQFKGDICKAISNGGYHIPTAAELDALNTSEFVNAGYTEDDQTAAATADGRYPMVGTFRKTGNIVLPASGYRDADWGMNCSIGNGGYYWSSTRFRPSEAYILYHTATIASFKSGSGYRRVFSVRCVTNQTPASIRIKDYLKNNVPLGAGVVK